MGNYPILCYFSDGWKLSLEMVDVHGPRWSETGIRVPFDTLRYSGLKIYAIGHVKNSDPGNFAGGAYLQQNMATAPIFRYAGFAVSKIGIQLQLEFLQGFLRQQHFLAEFRPALQRQPDRQNVNYHQMRETR